jgi:uncharacterized protein involved in tolerance to divalent cations
MDAVVIQTTAGSPAEAERIAEALLADGLAACVQIAAIRSRYVWQGAIQREEEQILAIKTRSELFEAVRAKIREVHSYETPEIIAVPVTAGDPDYLAWIADVTRRG